MAKSTNLPTFDVISEDEIEVTRRGRKAAELDTALVTAFKGLPAGKVARFNSPEFTVPEADDPKRQAIRAMLVRHATAAWGEGSAVSVRWSPQGVPQVSRKV